MPRDGRTLPGLLVSHLTCGVDARTGTWGRSALCRLSYAEGRVWTSAFSGEATTYRLPDGVEARDRGQFGGRPVATFLGRSPIDRLGYSRALEAAFGLDGYCRAVANTVAASVDLEPREDRVNTVAAFQVSAYAVVRDPLAWQWAFTDEFKAALAALPAVYSTEQHAVFSAFFQRWGTHVLVQGSFGGAWWFTLSATMGALGRVLGREYGTCLAAAMEAAAVPGVSQEALLEALWSRAGWDRGQAEARYGSDGGRPDLRLADFINAVHAEPTLMTGLGAICSEACRPVFRPLWRLVDPSRRLALEHAWLACLPVERIGESLPALPVPPATNVRTTRDGFLYSVRTGAERNRPDRSCDGQILLSTDGRATPTALRAANSCDAWWQATERGRVRMASAFVPVRAYDFYRVDGGTAHRRPAAWFQPATLALGAWTPWVDSAEPTLMAADGLFVATGLVSSDGDAASVVVEIGESLAALRTAGQASVWMDGRLGAWLCSSTVCVPVKRGQWLRLRREPQAASLQVDASFIALGDGCGWGQATPVGVDVGHLALNDCLVHGQVTGPEDGLFQRAVEVQVDQSLAFSQPVTVAAAEATGASVGGRPIPSRAFTAFVRAGSFFRVKTTGLDLGAGRTVAHRVDLLTTVATAERLTLRRSV